MKKRGLLILFISIILILLIAIGLYIFLLCPNLKKNDMTAFSGRYYAHRGLFENGTDHPENSMAAFSRAINKGYGFELDVHLTKDKRVVVVHDDNLLRLCSIDADVSELTYSDIQSQSIFGSGQRVPLLSNVLDLTKGRVPILIEYKLAQGASAAELCEATEEILKDYEGPYFIESFNPFILDWYKKNKPEIARGFLAQDFFAANELNGTSKFNFFLMKNLLLNFIARPDFIAYRYEHDYVLNYKICTKILGATPVAWTDRSPDNQEYLESHYAAIIFDSFEAPVTY